MRIAIFENEYETIENAFKYLNMKYYGNSLTFTNYPRSNSINNVTELSPFNLVIIDLDLSSASELDGFGLIKKIERDPTTIPNILILTGQQLSEDYAKDQGLQKNYPVLEKPINYNKLYAKFKEIGLTYP